MIFARSDYYCSLTFSSTFVTCTFNLSISPFLPSMIYLLVWTSAFSFYELYQITIIIYFVTQIVLDVAIGVSLNWDFLNTSLILLTCKMQTT
jgi:hypothetical protein